jgi:hypothetical protein
MTKLSAFIEAEQLTFDDVLTEFRHEIHSNGLCPLRGECYRDLGLVIQDCSWNRDSPPTWWRCGTYKRRQHSKAIAAFAMRLGIGGALARPPEVPKRDCFVLLLAMTLGTEEAPGGP